MEKKLTKNVFEKHLDSKFTISPAEGKSIETVLVKVTDHSTDLTEAFSLLFKGPKINILPQDTHKVNHGDIGEHDIFLGPVITQDDDGVYYEAVFNNLKEKN